MFDWPARLLLSPLLIAQAIRVRRTAQLLPEATGPRSGTIGSGPALSLRIVGDSSGAGVGVVHQSDALAGQLAALLGHNFTLQWDLDAATGATTRSTLTHLEQATPQPTDILITALGVNDVTRLIPPATWQRQQSALFDRLRALYQPRMIYMSGIPPIGDFPLLPNPLRWTLGRQARAYDTVQRNLAANPADITLVRFDQPLDPALMARDGFHPSAAVYALWAKEMASRIRSDWPILKQSQP